MTDKIKILHEPDKNEPFIILYKQRHIASAPLNDLDKDNALSFCLDLYPEIKNVKGKKEIEYGLVHRIDNVTDGLLLIACTQKAYDSFIEQQKEGLFIKKYRAICSYTEQNKEGFPFCKNTEAVKKMRDGEKISFVQTSLFRMYGPGRKEVRPALKEGSRAETKKAGSKEYSTYIDVTKKGSEYSAVCTIKEGFRHQVRSHLAWCSLPVKGDEIYNPDYKSGEEFLFTAFYLSFKNPVNEKVCVFEI